MQKNKIAIAATVVLLVLGGLLILLAIRGGSSWEICGGMEGEDFVVRIRTVPASEAAYEIVLSGPDSSRLQPFRAVLTPTSGVLADGVTIAFCDQTIRPGRFVVNLVGKNVDVTRYRLLVDGTEHAPNSRVRLSLAYREEAAGRTP
jgi:hypothetical protein